MRRHVARYYEGWLICDETSCRNRTRQVSVYGNHCIVGNCRGTMHHEVSSSRAIMISTLDIVVHG